eukprot:7501298-Heterocapsa_arctica.AAC.1
MAGLLAGGHALQGHAVAILAVDAVLQLQARRVQLEALRVALRVLALALVLALRVAAARLALALRVRALALALRVAA